MKIITRNRAKCLKCGDIVESKHCHDYQPCKCGAIAVDGGTERLSITGSQKDYEEMSEWGEA